MRVLMTLLLAAPSLMLGLMLAGCDKASAPPEQAETQEETREVSNAAQAVNPAMNPDGSRADITLESASGMTAVLTYAYAGSAAPTEPFTGADGRDVSLADFAGRPLLVNIWATWCGPCKTEMPTIDALAALEAGKMSVIAVSQDLEGRRPVMDFFDRAAIQNLEPYTDKDNVLMAAYGNIALPTTILFDSDGKEVWRVQGGLEWNDAEVAKLLREAS
jgi:thiol-disulfide isomerase/thioredoxin